MSEELENRIKELSECLFVKEPKNRIRELSECLIVENEKLNEKLLELEDLYKLYLNDNYPEELNQLINWLNKINLHIYYRDIVIVKKFELVYASDNIPVKTYKTIESEYLCRNISFVIGFTPKINENDFIIEHIGRQMPQVLEIRDNYGMYNIIYDNNDNMRLKINFGAYKIILYVKNSEQL